MGLNNKIQNSTGASYLFGTKLLTTANSLVAVGHFNEDVENATFVVGTGSHDENRVNSFTVMQNGRLGINTNDPSGELHIVNIEGLIIPKGNISERQIVNGDSLNDIYEGLMRYNTETKSFEGFGSGGNAWGSLGGVFDVSQTTYITAENSALSNNKQIKFYTDAPVPKYLNSKAFKSSAI